MTPMTLLMHEEVFPDSARYEVPMDEVWEEPEVDQENSKSGYVLLEAETGRSGLNAQLGMHSPHTRLSIHSHRFHGFTTVRF